GGAAWSAAGCTSRDRRPRADVSGAPDPRKSFRSVFDRFLVLMSQRVPRYRLLMIVGVPGEVKEGENRVALPPDGTRELTSHGHTVLVERGAGEGAAIHGREQRTAGPPIAPGD